MNYYPDTWVIVKIKDPTNNSKFYKVLGGWSGGYLEGDSWRFNSGIEKVVYKKETNSYNVYGNSGSIYVLNKSNERNSMATSGILSRFLEEDNVTLSSMKEVLKSFK